MPQAYYNAKAGVRKLTTETGAGQWGTALAFACALFGLECEVWQVGASYDQKPYRRMMIETFGGDGAPLARRTLTAGGPRDPRRDPEHPGSLGIAISEAVEVAAQRPGHPATRWAACSTTCCCTRRSSARRRCCSSRKAGETPDLIVGCTGGGSNFGGLAFPFLREKLAGRMSPTIRAVEPASCPSLTRGEYAYDFGDTAGMTPLLKMHTLGHDFVPDPIHAGGLRYHGMSPLISHIYELGPDRGDRHRRRPSASPPPSSSPAPRASSPRPSRRTRSPPASERRWPAKETGEEKVILTALCGHGHFDLAAYDAYLSGRMVDEDVPDERFAQALENLPQVPARTSPGLRTCGPAVSSISACWVFRQLTCSFLVPRPGCAVLPADGR